ncbi:cytochrome b561 [Enterobacteriaceae bacterium BIT-l23]|uniref:cytochrome b561 n=1 Tax=Jejubacter sp. L23 TaxID=3092086 RepID=UPI0015847CC8|nr:cytochrome b561 [Enterobacteriaceae bacterium BIT-l23]
MQGKFSSLQIGLHWLVLLLIAIAYCAMEFRGLAPREYRPVFKAFHFASGLMVLILMVARLVLRATRPTPPIVPKPAAWATGLAHLGHSALYLIFLALPVLGFLVMYDKGEAWSVLGIPMPHAADLNEDRRQSLKDLHELIANIGYFVIALHAAAALFHHYIWRDNTLLRMMPRRRDSQ